VDAASRGRLPEKCASSGLAPCFDAVRSAAGGVAVRARCADLGHCAAARVRVRPAVIAARLISGRAGCAELGLWQWAGPREDNPHQNDQQDRVDGDEPVFETQKRLEIVSGTISISHYHFLHVASFGHRCEQGSLRAPTAWAARCRTKRLAELVSATVVASAIANLLMLTLSEHLVAAVVPLLDVLSGVSRHPVAELVDEDLHHYPASIDQQFQSERHRGRPFTSSNRSLFIGDEFTELA